MNSFNSLLKKLLNNPGTKPITVRGQKKTIRGMARFSSANYDGGEYIKTAFSDHSLLVILLSEKEIYFAEKSLGKTTGIPDQMIGKKTVNYKGEKFTLDNKDDYQFCLQLYVGSPNTDIEGECRFFDYVSVDGEKILSLGWLSVSGKRADVLVEKVDIQEVSI